MLVFRKQEGEEVEGTRELTGGRSGELSEPRSEAFLSCLGGEFFWYIPLTTFDILFS